MYSWFRRVFCIKGKLIDWNEVFKLEILILYYRISFFDGLSGFYKYISFINRYICYIVLISVMKWGCLGMRY